MQSNVSLKTYNTFGIDVTARYLVEADNEQDIDTLFQLPDFEKLPKLVLGGGSNLLFTQDFNGVVLKNNIKGIEIVKEDADHVWVQVGAGENWHEFVLYCVERDWGGLENLSLIPGTVGAAPIQNIGAYGVELSATCEQVEAIALTDGKKRVFSREECRFGYRDSIFKHEAKGQYIITSVRFRLSKYPVLQTSYGDIQKTLDQLNPKRLNIKAVSDAVVKIRRSKLPDPAEIGNAGSFFKNPEVALTVFEQLKTQYPDLPSYETDPHTRKIPAAWLIEQCGWKGKRVGNVGVHTRQALVLVNHGNARGEELRQLSEKIKASVQQQFGISLQVEVNIL
ncbi:MAG: UDP-N-acetylmuramate dehydrogenase [Spirosomaceae bacterium]|nr:UDP-N-acetylmuramate dehydrogenase [Spirosomataceae bacterium]